jgi:hypothetical protein
MLTKSRNSALFLVILSLFTAELSSAQTPVGTRAAGMAGAFVAVADDASAVYWNPAGIATGSFVSAVIDFGRGQPLPGTTQTVATQQDTAAFVGVSATAIGLAYYRRGTYGTSVVEPAVTAPPSREEVGRSVHAMTTSSVGVSVVQSLTDHIVIGATPKLVRGGATTRADVDAGAMVTMNRFRLGLAAHNLTAPAFATATAGTPEIELGREVRVGGAWGSGWTGISRVIVSVDGDLTSQATPSGDRRELAAGVETWWLRQRLGLRGGIRRSTIGDARAAVAAGVSAGLTSGMLLEAHVVRGHESEHSWSVGARMLF